MLFSRHFLKVTLILADAELLHELGISLFNNFMKINYHMVDESLLPVLFVFVEGTELEKWMTGGRTSRMATQLLSM